MIIAIDGPAGSGKSSTAQEVARRLGFLHLDSGALYRGFAYAACRGGWTSVTGEVSESRIDEIARARLEVAVEDGSLRISLKGEKLGDSELRSHKVTACASKVAGYAPIRDRVTELLQDLAGAKPGGIVCEGRDIGTVVFPNARLKVYMTGSPEVRAKRRLAQRGEATTEEAVRAESARLVARDVADSERAMAPLRPADDAVVLDTSHVSFEEQVERVLELAGDRLDIA